MILSLLLGCATIVTSTANVQAQELPHALTQGGYYIGKTSPGATVTYQGKTIKPSAGNTFIIGFARDAETKQSFEVCKVGGSCTTTALSLTSRTYITQPIKGVADKHVNPNTKQVDRAERDSAAIAAARSKASGRDGFSRLFASPVKTYKTTGVYGSRRTYNGEERSWHKGLDFAAPTGTAVYAPAGATVTLARNTFFNGNLIILDHGNRLFTLYAHLDSMNVKPGDKVKEGEKIGAIGTTGRSTGPHLHWGVNWGNVALDPALFLRK